MSDADRRCWDERYSSPAFALPAPPVWLSEFEHELPQEGRALDVAAGGGRAAIWLAQRGYSVTAVDISSSGLKLAKKAARAAGVEIDTAAADLEEERLPAGPFAVICCFRYLQRNLFPEMRSRLEPGGLLLCEIATRRNLERNERPAAHHLLETNELRDLCAPLEVVSYREDWYDGQFLARAVARAPEKDRAAPRGLIADTDATLGTTAMRGGGTRHRRRFGHNP
ncbi:MAG: class I SAM-dependent methyltransferase [Dehalococcoidia bacterium]